MNNYYKSILYLASRRPEKIFTLFRLATGSRRFVRRSYRRSDNVSTLPVTVALRPTYRCNLRCVQCGQWGRSGTLRKVNKEFFEEELTTEQIKTFISEIAWFKPYLFFTGGEPLMRSDIFELIRFASSKNLVTSMSTNCTLLEEKAMNLMNSGLDYLFASFDGPPQINGTIRVGEYSAERAIKGIKAIVEARKKAKTMLPIIQVQFTLTQENQYSIFETARFIDKELHIEVFGLVPGVFTTEFLSNATSAIYKEEFNIEQKYWQGFIRDVSGIDCSAIEEQIDRIKSSKWNFRFRPYAPIGYKDFSFYEYFNHPEKVFGNIFCPTPYIFTQLQPNGDIATCGSHPDYIAGNILKDSFINIWNAEKYKQFRGLIKKKIFPSCSRCWSLYEFYKEEDL